jgi:hypothetical protein
MSLGVSNNSSQHALCCSACCDLHRCLHFDALPQHPQYRGFTTWSMYPHQLSAVSRQYHLSGASLFLLCLPPTDPVGGCYWRCRCGGGGAVSCSPGPERGRSIIDFLVKYTTSAWATNLWAMTSQIHHSEFNVSFVLPATLIGYRPLSEPLSF